MSTNKNRRNRKDWRLIRWKIWYRLTLPFDLIAKFLSRVLNIYRIAFLMTIIATGLWYFNDISIEALIPNIITDLLGIALAVFIVDAMYRLRSDAERKKVLISQLGSKNNAVATSALHELDAQGWLSDGSLQNAFLTSCNLDGNKLSGGDLRRAHLSFSSLQNTSWFETDLRGAFLDHANLTNATLSIHATGPHFAEADLTDATLFRTNLSLAAVRHEQLCRVKTLWGTTMPEGKLYDGRYNLKDDVENFLKHTLPPYVPEKWASYYGVSLSQYLEGQEWANKHLNQVRQ
ncbi:MAG: pentapeptide repeat-containing protein [Chloroflexi bacterium]|nr:pentapeptide repeat-containing protein [Chloroflexota bacterium]